MKLAEYLSGEALAGYFKGASERTHVQFFRYGFVAIAAFTVDFGSLALMVSGLRLNYLLAAALAFCLGLVTNYALSTIWVFNAYSVRSRWLEFSIFAITGVIGLGLTEILIWLFTDKLHLFYLVSKILTAFIVVIWNFGARKALLYR